MTQSDMQLYMSIDLQNALGLTPVARDYLSVEPLAVLPCWCFWSPTASMEVLVGHRFTQLYTSVKLGTL